MYAPTQFREARTDVLIAAIGSIRFATLVSPFESELDAVHLPLILREDADGLRLEGHVAIGNPFWRTASAGGGGLAIFQGPQAYVHPGWYETKKATGRVVPTWNYVAIHVRGELSAERDPGRLRDHMNALTAQNEAGRPEPWAVSDAPREYIDGMLRGIVGIRMAVSRMEGVWKMIQHHPEANRLGVIDGLAAGSPTDQAMATLMRERERLR